VKREVKTTYNVLRLFVVKEMEGLGRVLECKKCGAVFKSVKDAIMHSSYHLRKGDIPMDFFKDENMEIKREEKKTEKKVVTASLERWLK